MLCETNLKLNLYLHLGTIEQYLIETSKFFQTSTVFRIYTVINDISFLNCLKTCYNVLFAIKAKTMHAV